MPWTSMQHAMLQFVGIWALLNASAIAGFAALFLVEEARLGRARRRGPRGRPPVIPISGR